MIETEMTKNIFKHKTKFIGPFSAREFACALAGVGLGLGGYFTVFSSLSNNLRMGLSFLVILPFFLVGFMKIYDEPFEKMVYVIIKDNFLSPPTRLYETKFAADKIPAIKGKNGKKLEVKPSRKYKGVK